MNFIIWIVVGGLIGWVASMIMKTDAQQGVFLNIVVGIVGALLVGVFCFTPVPGLLEGNFAQLGKQAVGVVTSIVFCGVGTLIIALVVKKFFGLRVTEHAERDGLDITVHGERGYHL